MLQDREFQETAMGQGEAVGSLLLAEVAGLFLEGSQISLNGIYESNITKSL